MSLEVRKIAGAIGAEIRGVDLAREVAAATVREIRRAWLEHCVIFFCDQDLSAAQYMAFAESLGTPVEYPFIKGLEGFPCITPVVKLEHERANFGGIWHSDTTYLESPPMGTLLLAREVPPVGGDTLFANQYLAFETLSEGMQTLLKNQQAIHSARRPYGPQSHNANGKHLRSMKIKTGPEALAEFAHPMVRRHPATGRSALYVNPVYTIRLQGMTEDESAPLIGFLSERSVRPEFIIRVAWRPNMLTIWDNRVVQHLAVNDYDGHRRELHRTSVLGETPVAA